MSLDTREFVQVEVQIVSNAYLTWWCARFRMNNFRSTYLQDAKLQPTRVL